MTLQQVHRPTRSTVSPTPPGEETVSPPPPLDEQQGSTPFQALLPVMGAMSSVVMMVVLRNGNPLFLVVAGLVFVVAIVGGLGFALSTRGRQARQRRTQRELYLDYLEKLRRDLTERTTQARQESAVIHPDPAALASVIRDPARVWERRPRDPDFLQVRVGLGRVPWFDLTVPPPESPLEPHDPILLGEAELITSSYEQVGAMPVTADLRRAGVVAVVGDHAAGVASVRSILLQLASSHSPDDLSVAAVFSPSRADAWRGLDLLPHVQDPSLLDGPVPARRIAPDVASLGAVLGETLTDRLQHAHSLRRTGVSGTAPPHLVIVCDDHGRRASSLPLGASPQELGITVVHLLSDRLHEPSNVDVRLTLGADADEDGAGPDLLVTRPGTTDASESRLAADAPSLALFESTARSMSALRLTMTEAASEEEHRSLSVSELLGVGDPRSIDPEEMWRPRTREDFLKVPFGTDDHGNPVHLDLKESAQLGMGPHGICIGATGSGKSEMLRTLILSLALTHPPEDLSMILVDYKGGAAFAPFEGMPHLAGLIDNLADDPHLTTRARSSIQGEVVRRQQLLKDAGSSPSITHYRELRAENPDLPPMPHLFVVIDEFGELLTAEPDFIDLFLQIGRIGRSIGVHLLLSSQRIEGGKLRGLDTYLSYRLGLRTFDGPESQIVLGNSDAYNLPPLPGYGYLKVDTSVYTRFRSGYVSGAVRGPAPEQASQEDEAARPMLVPTYNGIARDDEGRSSQPARLAKPDTGRSFVEEAVDQVRDDDRSVRPVWLPPLPDRVAVGALLDDTPPSSGLSAVIGITDDPTKQAQDPWQLDLTRAGGHVVVIGAPQTGRSTLLRTVAVSLAMTRTPQEVAVYGMDLTGGGLQRLEGFPHVGGVATRSHRDRLQRLLEELSGMIAHREQVFRDRGIDSLAQLRTLHAQGKIPELSSADVVVLVDGYGTIRQDFPELEDSMTDIMLRASSFGVHLVITLTRWSELRMAHQALFGTRIELRLNDPADSGIERKLSKTLSADTPGRALLDSKLFGQVAQPVLDLVPDDEVADEVESLAERSKASWSGPAAAPIRLLPMHLGTDELPDIFDEPDTVPIGLRRDTMGPALWDFLDEDQHLMALGDAKCGKSSLLRLIASGMIERYTSEELAIAVIDTRGHVPSVIPDDYLAAHARSAGQAQGMCASIAAEMEQRQDRTPEENESAPRVLVLVDDFDIVSAGNLEVLGPLLPYLPSARDLGLHIVLTRPMAGSSRALFGRTMQTIRDTGGSMLLMSGERGEGQIINRIYPERFPPGRGRYVRRGENPHVIQLAQLPEEADA